MKKKKNKRLPKRILSFALAMIMFLSLMLTMNMTVYATCYPNESKGNIEVVYNSTGESIQKIVVHFAYYDSAFSNSRQYPIGYKRNTQYNIVFSKNENSVINNTDYNAGAEWNFIDSNAIYSNSAAKSVPAEITEYRYFSAAKKSFALFEGDFEITETSLFDQIESNTTYYALVMCGITGGKWYSGSYVPINLSTYRHHVTFDYKGHGGTNFVLPVKNYASVTDAASSSNPDYTDSSIINSTVKSKIDNWSTAVTTPTESNYIFGGWYTDDTCITPANFGNHIVQSTTFYAKWITKVTFYENGGTWTSGYTVPTEYKEGTGLTLPTSTNISKSGYSFDGWYTNEESTGSAVTTITISDTGNKTYYAKWTHVHGNWSYSVGNTSTLKATCGNAGCTNVPYSVSFTLSATSPTYSGSEVTANYGEGEATTWNTATGSTVPTITYEKKTESNIWSAIESAPINVGEYRAVAKFTNASTDFTAFKEFVITPASIASITYTTPTVSATGAAATATNLEIASDAKYTGDISWSPADTSFGYNKTYTATVTLTAKDNYVFDSDATIPTGWAKSDASTTSLVLIKTFDTTAKAKITSIASPSVTSPLTSFTTELAQLAALPATVTIAVEDSSVTSMSITWNLKSGTTYSTELEAENVFVWTITASAYANFDTNGKLLTGEVTIKNPTHTHEFATSWAYDATNHWHACTADGNSDSCLTETLAAKAAHLGGTATCQAKAACTTCGQSYGDYGAHNWGAWDATTGTRRCTTAGCTETQTCDHNGQTEAICSICGKILRCLHTERTYVAKIASTCIEHGTDAYWRCDSCGEKFSTQTGDTHITDESVLELPFSSHSRRTSPAYAATCTELGKTRGVYCIVCGEVFETEIYTPSFGHDFGEEYVIDKAPTCLEEGIKSLYCSRCGARTNITTIPMAGHSEVAIGTAKAATCLEEGLTAGSKCSVCGVIIEEQKAIPKTGHAYSEEYIVDVEPTCTKEGSKSRHCTTEGCTAKTDVTVVEKAAHTEVAIGTAKAATCLEEGLTAGSKCSVCGEIIEEQKVVPVTDHNYSSEYTVDKEPTCSEEGSKSRYCTTEGCTANTDVTAIAKIAHTETEFGTRVEPTCIATGLTTGIKCSVCGEIIKEQQTVAMINHNYSSEYKVDKEATCTEEGSKSRHCTTEGCTAKTDVTVIEKIAHTEVTDNAVKESCTKDGLTEGKHCSVCGTTIVAQNTIPATGHTYSESWTVVKEATATEEGRKETSCVNGCGTKKYASIPATGVKEDTSTKGDLDKGIEVADDAPVESASFDNTKSELLEASGLFTEEEKEDIKNGIDAKIYLVIEKVEEDEVPVEEQNMVSSATSEELGEDAIIDYIDISLFKQVGENEAEKVHEPGTEIKVTLEIPEEMLVTEKGEVRKYRIVKIHNGKIEVIKGRFNPKTNEFSFSTDEFSTYALVYSDEKMEIVINLPEIPGGNGDGTPVIKKGDEIKIDVKVTPEEDAPQDITITSSNPSVVEVDPDGTIKGVGIGSSIITIKTIDGTVEKELKITVDEEVKDDNPGTDGDNSGTNGNTDTVNDNPDKNSGTSGTSNSTDDTNNGNAGTDTNGGHKCTLFTWCSCFCWCMVLRFILIALIVAAGVYFGLKAKKKDKKEKK